MLLSVLFFFFNDTATTEIYTLSLHDALPISLSGRKSFLLHGCGNIRADRRPLGGSWQREWLHSTQRHGQRAVDRKSTRLNSSHANISYAVFCLKKKHNPHAHTRGCVDTRLVR